MVSTIRLNILSALFVKLFFISTLSEQTDSLATTAIQKGIFQLNLKLKLGCYPMDSALFEKNKRSRFNLWSIGSILTDGAKPQELIFLYER